MIAGPGLQGTIMVSQADMRDSPQAAEVVQRVPRAGLRAAGIHAQRLRRHAGLGTGGRGGWLAGSRCGDPGHAQPRVRHGTRAGSASTRKATSRASSRGNGSSGRRRRHATCRWSTRALRLAQAGIGEHSTRTRAWDFPHCRRSSASAEYFDIDWRSESWSVRDCWSSSVISVAALCARAAEAEIRIGVAGADDRCSCLVRRAVSARRRAGGRGPQRPGWRARPTGRADHGVTISVTPSRRWRCAQKLASDGVVFVAGHFARTPRSPLAKVYEKAKILMISPSRPAPMLTD